MSAAAAVDTPVVRVGVGVMLLAPAGYVFMRRQGSHGAGSWSFPGGHLEYGESVLECAVRECREELGVELKDPSVVKIFTEDFFAENDASDDRHYITLYVTGWCSQHPRICEPAKCDGLKFVALGDVLPDPLFSGVEQAWAHKLATIVNRHKNG